MRSEPRQRSAGRPQQADALPEPAMLHIRHLQSLDSLEQLTALLHRGYARLGSVGRIPEDQRIARRPGGKEARRSCIRSDTAS